MPVFAKISNTDIQKNVLKRKAEIEKNIALFKKVMREANYSMQEIFEITEKPEVQIIARNLNVSDEKHLEMFRNFLESYFEK